VNSNSEIYVYVYYTQTIMAFSSFSSFHSSHILKYLIAPFVVSVTEVGTGTGTVSIAFTRVTGATSYNVYTILSDGTSGPVTSGINSSPVSITGLNPGSLYTFKMTSSSAQGKQSAFSNILSSITLSGLLAPTNLAVSETGTGAGKASLTFTASTGATSYTLFSSLGGASYVTAPSYSVSGTTVSITGLTQGGVYTFQMKSTNSSGVSSVYSSPTSQLTITPAAPNNLILSEPSPGYRSATLNFNGSPGASSYNFYSSLNSGGYNYISPSSFSGTTASFSNLSIGSTYTFYVTASINGKTSTNSPTSNVITMAAFVGIPFTTTNAVTTGSGNVSSYYNCTFTSSGTFTLKTPKTVYYLVVAGGGSGRGYYYDRVGGGGGAGGYKIGSLNLTEGTYNVVVGVGGKSDGSYGGGVNSNLNTYLNGGDSSFFNITSNGGGSGSGSLSFPAKSGGSGGGGSQGSNAPPATGLVSQGFSGGFGGFGGYGIGRYGIFGGGGGGGAGGVGGNYGVNATASGGNGGPGITVDSSNFQGYLLSTTLCGGGGGGMQYQGVYNGNYVTSDTTISEGGSGGWGCGGYSNADTSIIVRGCDATANTGGGGGGSANNYNNDNPALSGSGGSGLVVLSLY
jgi:hypothetical protein